MEESAPAPVESPWLTRSEAATYLRLSVKSLEAYARTGIGGPPYFKSPSGTCRYRRDLLDAWMGEAVSSSTQARSRRATRSAAA